MEQIEDLLKRLENPTYNYRSSLINEAIEALIISKDMRPFIAERIEKFGGEVIPPIENLLSNTNDEDLQEVCSLLLLELGSYTGIETLLNSIVNISDWAILSAKKLSLREISGISDTIIEALRKCDDENYDIIVGLLDALKKTGEPLPYSLIKRFSKPDIPWQIRTFVDEM